VVFCQGRFPTPTLREIKSGGGGVRELGGEKTKSVFRQPLSGKRIIIGEKDRKKVFLKTNPLAKTGFEE